MHVALPLLAEITPRAGLLFGLMLVAAIVGGYAAHLAHIPRVIGFLVGGVALRIGLNALLDPTHNESARQALTAAAAPLHSIRDLALGLILFTIGGVFQRAKLRAIGRGVLRISALEIGLVLAFVLVLCGTIAWVARFAPDFRQAVVLAALLATAAVATAPAATLFVLNEYQAKGPVTDTVLGLTGLNNIVCIVLFQVVFLVLASVGVIETTGPIADRLGLALLASTFGSVAIGLVVGTAISILHAKLSLSETLLFFFAVFILLGAAEDWLWHYRGVSYNFLLTALVSGAVFANVALDSQKLETALRTFGAPVFVGFFAMAGYDLHLEHVASMGLLGAAYVLARFGGKWLGCRWGTRWAQGPSRVDGRLGGALLCQAAVVIGLAAFVERNWNSELATQFGTVVLGSVVVFELIGPILVKRCVVQAGEIKAITLLGRAVGLTEGASIVRLTLRSLGRIVGLQSTSALAEPENLTVNHIMRTNVQFISASATFDDVLHHIEGSTYSHFPVVRDGGEFVGMIHFSDVRDVIYDPTLSELLTAVDLADVDSHPVPMDLPLRELLDRFTQQNVAVLPVVEKAGGARIVGLVEQRDLLRALHISQDPR